MKESDFLYLHEYQGNTIINVKPYYEAFDYSYNSIRIPGIKFSNSPFRYKMEFFSLAPGYDGVYVKLLTAPIPNLINLKILLDGCIFEDMMKYGNITFLGQTAELEENLVIKYKGVTKLCRPQN